MQTINLIIPGEYYDSYIYSGKLYLWQANNSLLILNWDKLIDRIIMLVGEHLKFAAYCGLRKGRYLYGYEWELFSRDNEMQTLLQSRFLELSQSPIELSASDIDHAAIQHINNPFSFPHADMLIYNNSFYSGSSQGLQMSNNVSNTEISQKTADKIWDGPSLSLTVNRSNLAIAAGSDGLYEGIIDNRINQKKFLQRSDRSSNFVRWLYPSIFSSSYSGGYLADYALEKPTLEGEDEEFDTQDKKTQENVRIYRETLTAEQLFDTQTHTQNSNTYSWGVHDKICFASDNFVQVIRFVPETPSKRKSDAHINPLGTKGFGHSLSSEIVSADSSYFGCVIETEDGLLIFNSQNESTWLDDEPVNWRVYSESRDYLNHFHIVYDDYLSIHSFTHDYFVNQREKTIGISYGVKR